MALLTVQDLTIAGVVPSYTAVSSSDTFPLGNDKVWVHVKNGGGSPDTVAIDAVTNCSQGFDHDGGSSVTNGTEKMFLVSPASRFMGTGGTATITHTFTTSVTIGVFKLP